MDTKSAPLPLEEIQRIRAERKAAARAARDEQRAVDLAALNDLEAEYGDDRVAFLEVPSFVPGLPTGIVLRTATRGEAKRFSDAARKAKAQPGAAVDLLASSVVVYPDRETYARMLEEWGNLHESAGARAVQMIQAKADDEGKA